MNDFLAIEAPGMTRIEILPRRCSLTETVRLAINAVAELAEKSNISLVGPGEQVEAYADPDRVVQVLVNLLSNAIKFSPPNSSVVVSICEVDGQIEVRVSDIGRGVPVDQREAIFERFQQVTASDAIEKGGTGLGLPICREIIELHGGRIGVESEAGKGSTFWFRLPARSQGEE
jgi:signal transduction histidine kinase